MNRIAAAVAINIKNVIRLDISLSLKYQFEAGITALIIFNVQQYETMLFYCFYSFGLPCIKLPQARFQKDTNPEIKIR